MASKKTMEVAKPAVTAAPCLKKAIAKVSFPQKRRGKVCVVSAKRAFPFGTSLSLLDATPFNITYVHIPRDSSSSRNQEFAQVSNSSGGTNGLVIPADHGQRDAAAFPAH